MARTMKDSGVEWIGKIPADWKISKIKYVAEIYNGNSISDSDKDNYTVRTNIPYIATKDIDLNFGTVDYENGLFISPESNFKIAPVSSTLLCIEGGSAGKKKAFLTRAVAFVNKLCAFVSRDIDSRFLFFCIDSAIFKFQFDEKLGGLIGGVSLKDIKNIFILFPPIEEQKRIAAFLDTECARIDSVIEKTRASIEEYKKLKQAVITQAVTKGIRPNRTMKDSGIEWIGKIPADWKLLKGKYLFRQRNEQGNSIELQLLSPTQKYGVIPQHLYEELTGMKAVKLDERADYSTLKSIYQGDFCISLRSFQGGFEYSKYNGVVSPAYQVFFKIKNLCDSYYRYLFKDKGFIAKMTSYTKTFRDGKSISFTDFGNSQIPVPPIEEQKEITAYLDEKCKAIDNLIAKKQKLLAELESYKKSLIFEYVTGKKEVPT